MKAEVTKADVYTRVTDKIIASLEAGTRPWMRPWDSAAGGPPAMPLRGNGQAYRGVNVLLLWAEAAERGYRASTWMTYKQAAELGAQVRKGEKGAMVVYADTVHRTETNDKGEDVERAFGFMKAYTVFNVEQIDGLGEGFYPVAPVEDTGHTVELIDHAEAFFAGTGAAFRHGGHSAFYAPGPDVIQLPPVQSFHDAESYAATKAHELIHWTGHQDRMAREFGKRYGDRAYAFEELVAEMGAAFLCADLAITPKVRGDHADYLASWLEVLKEDKRAIFAAASHAQKAMDFLHGLQGTAVAAPVSVSTLLPAAQPAAPMQLALFA